MNTTSNNTLQSSKEEVKRTYRHWTTLEDRKLLQLRESGLKFKTIADQLCRTPISVEKRFRKILKNN
ncbi:hypothetical protein [Metabacillus litoralis]|uniref:hypothetical protein n=1 Tax=Metabacillus litoralis TaxID=152268 RepID=UPI001CFCF863|nr:hypothetical protein [Metabacillus litoralis]